MRSPRAGAKTARAMGGGARRSSVASSPRPSRPPPDTRSDRERGRAFCAQASSGPHATAHRPASLPRSRGCGGSSPRRRVRTKVQPQPREARPHIDASNELLLGEGIAWLGLLLVEALVLWHTLGASFPARDRALF